MNEDPPRNWAPKTQKWPPSQDRTHLEDARRRVQHNSGKLWNPHHLAACMDAALQSPPKTGAMSRIHRGPSDLQGRRIRPALGKRSTKNILGRSGEEVVWYGPKRVSPNQLDMGARDGSWNQRAQTRRVPKELHRWPPSQKAS
ncbi:hypothetical protein Nepgr_019909 [Nepenthes gracilis]|uniref:Uncharacterized protein n=1 Tax=Nepenthes gracilis TaxID=150966 RepID=A0AAD3SUZ6_NEPGR|nr:hypothetical protein Nepgr_019909 [Nepenthes gracilis]